MSPSTITTLESFLKVSVSSRTRMGSFSTAITFPTFFCINRVSVPCPGPGSRTVSDTVGLMLETMSHAMLRSRRKFCPSLFQGRWGLRSPTISYCPCEETILGFSGQLFENAFRYYLPNVCQTSSVLYVFVAGEWLLLPRVHYGPH